MTNLHTDRDRLEREYHPWADSQPTMDKWAQMSVTYLDRADMERNLSYGALPTERLDLLKSSTPNAPVLIFIHGGYWQWLDKDDYAFALEPLVTAGALVATINYPLCPEVSLDILVERVRSACAWVWRNVRHYGGDPERLHVAGHSAGGHLAAMLAATDWQNFQLGLPNHIIKSIIPISGLFDLEPIRLISLNDGMGMDQDTAKRNSPLFISPTHALPVTVVVGGDESGEFQRQSREFSDAWRNKAGRLEYLESPGHDHFTVIESMTEPNNILTATILRHLELKA